MRGRRRSSCDSPALERTSKKSTARVRRYHFDGSFDGCTLKSEDGRILLVCERPATLGPKKTMATVANSPAAIDPITLFFVMACAVLSKTGGRTGQQPHARFIE